MDELMKFFEAHLKQWVREAVHNELEAAKTYFSAPQPDAKGSEK